MSSFAPVSINHTSMHVVNLFNTYNRYDTFEENSRILNEFYHGYERTEQLRCIEYINKDYLHTNFQAIILSHITYALRDHSLSVCRAYHKSTEIEYIKLRDHLHLVILPRRRLTKNFFDQLKHHQSSSSCWFIMQWQPQCSTNKIPVTNNVNVQIRQKMSIGLLKQHTCYEITIIIKCWFAS